MKRAKGETAIILTVARNVRALRKVVGLSQEELAHEAEVDRTYVSQVERGKRNMTIWVLARLAAALKTTPDVLLIPTAVPVDKRKSRKKTG